MLEKVLLQYIRINKSYVVAHTENISSKENFKFEVNDLENLNPMGIKHVDVKSSWLNDQNINLCTKA